MRSRSVASSPRLSATERPVLALSFLRCRSPAPARHCLRRLRPGAGLSRSLADFGDTEVARPRPPWRGRRSAAGPDAIPPVEAIAVPLWGTGHQGFRDHRGRGASRMAVGGGSGDHRELAQPDLAFGFGLMLPSRESDPPELAPPREATTHSVPEPACTTVPVSAQQLSSASGRVRGVSLRAVTHRSAPIPRTSAQRYRERGCRCPLR
jgi:hypothetical protein